jgi:hypothetical protein
LHFYKISSIFTVAVFSACLDTGSNSGFFKINSMKTTTRTTCLLAFSYLIITAAQSQDPRPFNQNTSGSNHSLYSVKDDAWSFSITTGASLAVKSDESTLFRGNGMATKLSGNYYFGPVGLSLSSGIIAGDISSSSLNNFLTERKIPQDQVQITKGKPFNTYLLFGPSFRFGHRILVNADLQGGLFFNSPGAVSITQPGAARPLYRFDAGDKNLFPGFSGSISIVYPINRTTHFSINTGYLQSKSSIRLFDPQAGIDVVTQVNREVKLFTAGIGIIKSFGARHETSGGMATGKKHIGNVKYEDIKMTAREASSGMATGRIISNENNNGIVLPGDAQNGLPTGRTYRPGRPVYGNVTRQTNQSCGPVTLTTTNPDGTTEQRTFACPNDAAQYNERISMNTTVPRQTQGASFGEKVNAGLHAAGGALAQGRSLVGVISGNVGWGPGNSSGIVTNQNAVSAVGTLSGGSGGGAASASYAATGRMNNNPPGSRGLVTMIYAREAGSGMATGRREYQPVFTEGGNISCTDCGVSVKLIAHELTHVLQQSQGSVKDNPLYIGNAQQGTNPMFENKIINTINGDCDGVAGLDVCLMDINSGAAIAHTKTGRCGDFFFANVPAATYTVKVTGGFSMTKAYDVNINKDGKSDIAGEMLGGENQWTVRINSSIDNGSNQKASINTTRSNIKHVTLINSNMDADGNPESFRAIAVFGDGASGDLIVKGGNNAYSIILPANNANTRTGKQGANLVGLNLSGKNIVTAMFSDGTTRDITNDAKISPHPNVVQLSIDLADTDGDGFADAIIKTKTKSNQSNDRVAAGDTDGDGIIWSPKSNFKSLPVVMGDIDEDGETELLVGGMVPGGSVISAAMRPGTPVGGVTVKGAKNPAVSLHSAKTNEYGEFEFIDLEKGNYTISAELKYYIDDETIVSLGDDDNDGLNERKGWDGTIKGGTKNDQQAKAQNNNTVSSNRTELKSILIEADLDGDGEYEADVTDKVNDEIMLDENGQIIASQQRAGVSVSRSNIRNRTSLQNAGDGLYVSYGYAVINNKEVAVKSVLKTKHDTVKNSIGNIR